MKRAKAVQQIARREETLNMQAGIVRAVRGQFIDVLLAGGKHIKDVGLARGITTICPGWWVVIVRTPRSHRWIAIAVAESPESGSRRGSGTLGDLVQPASVTATAKPYMIELSWAGTFKDVACYEVMHNSSASATGATTLKVEGANYFYWCIPGTQRYFRVRAVSSDFERSSWSSWVNATSLSGAAYNVLHINSSATDIEWTNAIMPDRIGVGCASIPALDGVIGLPEVIGASVPFAPNEGRIYAKDVGGVTELFWKDDQGREIQLSDNGAAGGSLSEHTHHDASTGGAELWPDRLGVGTASIPAFDGVIGLPEVVGASVPFAPNEGRIYVKDVDGNSELFYKDDDGDEIQITRGGMIHGGDYGTNLVIVSDEGGHATTVDAAVTIVNGHGDAADDNWYTILVLNDTTEPDNNITIPSYTRLMGLRWPEIALYSARSIIPSSHTRFDSFYAKGSSDGGASQRGIFTVNNGAADVIFDRVAAEIDGANTCGWHNNNGSNIVCVGCEVRGSTGLYGWYAHGGDFTLYDCKDYGNPAYSLHASANRDIYAYWGYFSNGGYMYTGSPEGCIHHLACYFSSLNSGIDEEINQMSVGVERCIIFQETATNWGGGANTGSLICKDDGSGNTELYYVDESDNVEKLTPPEPSGIIVLWNDSDSCPTGYTEIAGAANRMLLIVASGPGGTGGTTTHAHGLRGVWSVPNYEILEYIFQTDAVGGDTNPYRYRVAAGSSTVYYAGATTVATSHLYSYYECVICEKN